MSPIFVDTSALIALSSKRDKFHKKARRLRRELVRERKTFATTDAVILEVASYFSRSQWRPTAVRLIKDIKNSKAWNCLTIDDDLMKRGFKLYESITDKDWTLVDCIGIVVARDLEITEIFTTDHHFEQAGFKILLKP
jgi:predicted nucleic acid-binding protein